MSTEDRCVQHVNYQRLSHEIIDEESTWTIMFGDLILGDHECWIWIELICDYNLQYIFLILRMSEGSWTALAKTYCPLMAGSIDRTDTEPHTGM